MYLFSYMCLCTCVYIVGSSHGKLLSMAHKSHIFALIFGFFSVTSALNYSALSTPPSPTRLIFCVSLQLDLGITSSKKPSLIFLNWVRVSPVYFLHLIVCLRNSCWSNDEDLALSQPRARVQSLNGKPRSRKPKQYSQKKIVCLLV